MPLEFDGVNGIVKNTTSDGDVTIKGNDDGSEISAVIFDMSTAGKATFNNDIALGDNQKAVFGASEDLQIFHDGSNSYIKDEGTGDLKITSNGNAISFQKGTSETMAFFDTDAGCELYHNNTAKFITTATGATISGQVLATGGAVSAPTYAFDNDSNTGMTRPTTDTVTLVTAGSERVRIDSSGNVGIGTSSIDVITQAGGSGYRVLQLENAEGGQINLDHNDAGTGSTLGMINFNRAGETVAHIGGVTDGATDSGHIQFRTQPASGALTERMRITSAGNVGIATSNPSQTFSVAGHMDISATSRLYLDGGGNTFISEVSADTIAFTTGNSEIMRITNQGRCGFNSSSPDETFHIKSSGSPSGDVGLILEGSAADANCSILFHNSSGTERGRILYDTDDNNLQVKVNAAEKLRITSGGFLKAITSGSFVASAQFHEFTNSSGSQQTVFFRHSDANHPYGLQMEFSAAAPDNNTHWFYLASDSSAVRFRVMSDGDVQDHDNAYGSISDERIKQDIRDSNSQWDDIKAVRVRNFKKKDDVRQYGDNAWEQIGVVAQELEAVSPKLIRQGDPTSSDILSDSSFGTLWTAEDIETQEILWTADDPETKDVLWTEDDELPEDVEVGDVKEQATKSVGDVKEEATKSVGDVKEVKEQVKSVNYSVLYMKAIKALQEAQTRIETLETKVAALEG